ncbi:hypothetical protein [Phenylobacterium sp. CCH9-H3]|jgi:hypothetical protein|uniref:hypothetical protein n=1 Tax=Phenylobacterium sp. CCH9-H3 TaxID=1768774 RepID=UPI0012E859D9|nr:hypothetical protein [Phenylobacterium sp. CCH9-H3]
MAHLKCAACGRSLTRTCRVGELGEYDNSVADTMPALPPGVMVRLTDEDVVPLTDAGGVVGVHVYSPAGAWALNPEDLLRDAVAPSGVRNGCCGPDGADGPNFSCVCGNVLGTEWGDCWTQAEVRFLPDAVVVAE